MTAETVHCSSCWWNETTNFEQEEDGVCPECGSGTAVFEKAEEALEPGDRVEVDGVGPVLEVTRVNGRRVWLEGPRGGEYGANLWRNEAPLRPWCLELWRESDRATVINDPADDAPYKGSANYRVVG